MALRRASLEDKIVTRKISGYNGYIRKCCLSTAHKLLHNVFYGQRAWPDQWQGTHLCAVQKVYCVRLFADDCLFYLAYHNTVFLILYHLIIISKNLHSALFHQTLNNIFYITEKQHKQNILKSFKDAFSWNSCKFIDIIQSESGVWNLSILLNLNQGCGNAMPDSYT